MYTKTFRSDLELWIEVAKTSLHSGNAVGSARLHALQMMIETRIGFEMIDEERYLPLMHNLCRLCEFGKEIGTAHEKNIFIHIMIDMMNHLLQYLPSDKAAPVSQEWVSPLPLLGEIPF